MKIHLLSNGFELNRELEKYANSKVAQVAKEIPRKLRPVTGCEIVFSQTKRGGTKLSTCSVSLTLDGVELKAEETTQHMYAALDIATVHIAQQLNDWLTREHPASSEWQLP